MTKDLGLNYKETRSSVKDSQSMNNSMVTIGIHFPRFILYAPQVRSLLSA